ncbi:epimerase [Rhodanobacter lindaniclasticus]|jgi:UDP-glucose 4-epimerase|uniref:UDP-glucose 4-epimerase n=2 Tax=Rhodanobacter lindaniclasticus TaxID=75310 RepID=A0A4S3KJ22_9GAMM|nr:epimerase [Rhodanobacter lindaniclasticus]
MTEPVLILGAGGFVGRSLTRALVLKDTPVIAVNRSARGFEHPLVESIVDELRAPEAFASLLARSRAVVHLASTSTPGTSAARPLQEVNANLHTTAALLEALQEHPEVELLYMSSGGSLYADTSGLPSDENARVHPRSYHGAAKLASEYLISAWCDQFHGKATILRPSNIYGPGQPERPGFGIIPAAFGKIRRNETLHVWGDGSVRRDYVYIDDLVRLCNMVLDTPMPEGPSIFNACSGISVSLNELFDVMEAATGQTLHRSYDAGRAVDASCIAMSAAHAASIYGWHHLTPLKEGLAQTWEWTGRAQS